jgi:hypothetical protein
VGCVRDRRALEVEPGCPLAAEGLASAWVDEGTRLKNAGQVRAPGVICVPRLGRAAALERVRSLRAMHVQDRTCRARNSLMRRAKRLGVGRPRRPSLKVSAMKSFHATS